MNDSTQTTKLGKILIVDDNPITLNAMTMALSDDFEVISAESGEACLETLEGFDPDLIFLDIEMDGIDGLETCRRLRQTRNMPVIFVSSHDTLEERLMAFDSGGDDFIIKPFDGEVLHRKAIRMVELHARHEQLAGEKDAAHQIAMNFLKSVGETGVLLNFMRSSLGCIDYSELAERLVEATREYGIQCHVQVRHADGSVSKTPHGLATPLETSILDQSAALGRIFQFKRRLVVNYDLITILAQDVPDDADVAGRLRDSLAILAENAEAIAETINVRKKSALLAEAMQAATIDSYRAIEELRSLYMHQMSETRVLLDDLTKQVEDTYVFLGLTDNQEATLSETIRNGSEQILHLFSVSDQMDQRFSNILRALEPKGEQPPVELW